jgi:hypothetical protein
MESTDDDLDDDLKDFAANGVALPADGAEAVTVHDGARIWHAR